MKKILPLLFSTFLLCVNVKAQEEKNEFNLLQAPSSPASNLLGIATTDIDKPTDISSFMVSIQSASNSFSKFPSNYAIDFSPYYLFGNGIDFTTSGMQKTGFKNIFKQTFVISLAISNPDSTSTNFNYKSTYGGFGIKFSLFRGKYDDDTKKLLKNITDPLNTSNSLLLFNLKKLVNTEEYINIETERDDLIRNLDPSIPSDKAKIKKIKKSKHYQELENKLLSLQKDFKNKAVTDDWLTKNDSVYKELKEKQKKMTENSSEYNKIQQQLIEMQKNYIQNLDNEIKKKASEFQIQRIGFSWDVNSGVSGEFRNRNFNNSKFYNAGVWTNLGYTFKNGIGTLGLLRYLYNPDKILALDNSINEFENVSTFDAGARITYSKSQSKFSCSFEAIYRSILSGKEIDPSWKMIFNADYAIMKNQKLTFSFGRDFDGTITKDGNLIAALTLIAGFGNKR